VNRHSENEKKHLEIHQILTEIKFVIFFANFELYFKTWNTCLSLKQITFMTTLVCLIVNAGDISDLTWMWLKCLMSDFDLSLQLLMILTGQKVPYIEKLLTVFTKIKYSKISIKKINVITQLNISWVYWNDIFSGLWLMQKRCWNFSFISNREWNYFAQMFSRSYSYILPTN